MQKTFSTFIVMLSYSLALAQAPNTYDLNPGNGNGLRFWSADSYKIHMGNAAEYKYGPVTDYSIKMNMSNTATRGWTWGVQNTVPIAALSTLGHMQIAGNFVSMGNIGIGNTTPIAKLQVTNGSVLFDGATGAAAISGAGTRMMWIPAKAAFRAGTVSGNEWDDANIGQSSFACGLWTKASGGASFAAGWSTNALGPYSAAFGFGPTASSFASAAFGNGSTASGAVSFVTGWSTTASGDYSFSAGVGTKAEPYASVAIGQYNITNAAYNKTTWVATDPLFVIGNGTSPAATSNAMTVLKNGNVGIGKIAPTEVLDVNGNINVNANKLYLQAGDINHGLGYFHTFTTTGNYANKDFDGPVLFGWEGGGLGTNRGSDRNVALSWNYLGQVGIGSKLEDPSSSGYKLLVNGNVRAKKIVVESTWSDFVFEKNYKLKTLQEVEKYIQQYGHLPEIPSANEIECNGGDLGELVKLQMQKIEELTLYIIEQNKRIEALENSNENSK